MNAGTAAFGALALACGTLAVHYARELDGERTRAAQLEARLAALDRGREPTSAGDASGDASRPTAAVPASAQRRSAGAQLDAAGVHAVAEPARASAPASGSADPLREQARSMREEFVFQRDEHVRRMRDEPEYRAARIAQQKLAVRRNLPGLAAELGLTSAEADALYAALAEEQLRTMYDAAMFFPGETPSDADLATVRERKQAAAAARDARVRETIGEAGFARWQQYEREAPGRWAARELREVLTYTSSPLQPEQERGLAKAFASELLAEREQVLAEAQRLEDSGRVPAADELVRLAAERLARQEALDRRLHEAAAPLLDAEQLRQFDAMRANQRTIQRAEVRSAAVRATATRGAGASERGTAARTTPSR